MASFKICCSFLGRASRDTQGGHEWKSQTPVFLRLARAAATRPTAQLVGGGMRGPGAGGKRTNAGGLDAIALQCLCLTGPGPRQGRVSAARLASVRCAG